MLEAFGPAKGIECLERPDDRRGGEFTADTAKMAMIACNLDCKVPKSIRYLQAPAELQNQFDPTLLVPLMTGPHLFRCIPLAEIMHEGCKSHLGQRAQTCRLLQHQHRVYTGIDLGMKPVRLGNAKQARDLRKQPVECATAPKDLEKALRRRFCKCAGRLFPDTLRHQIVDLSTVDHLSHEGIGLMGDVKTVARETRCKTRDAQDAHRVFTKSRRDMS